MHAASLAQLQTMANQAMQQPAGQARVDAFLNGLGPIHLAWHQQQLSQRNLGFLLFHWHVVDLFKTVGGPASFGGITAFTTADFRQFGWPYNVSISVPKGNVAKLTTLSLDIEHWHNRAHMVIKMKFGVDLMDPATNIKLVQFWQLHYFINAKFEGKLKTFRRNASMQPAAVVADIETRNHAAVPTI